MRRRSPTPPRRSRDTGPHGCACMGLQAPVHRVAGSRAYACRATFMFSATNPVSMLIAPNSFSMTQIFLPWSC